MNVQLLIDEALPSNTKTSTSTRSDISPLRYPGGKRKLAPLLAKMVLSTGKRTDLFIEPFAGGASVSISLLEAGYVDSIGLSDLDPLIASFWQTVFSKNATELADRILNAELSVDEWRKQKLLIPNNSMEAAYKCIYLNRTSFSGSLNDNVGPMGGYKQTSENKINSRFNQEKMANRILELMDLRGSVKFIKNQSYLNTIDDVARLNEKVETIWYFDPPFFDKANRLYRYWFENSDHKDLVKALDDLNDTWILSYDDHPLARAYYEDHPGFALVNLQYSKRSPNNTRPLVSEVIVSDIIHKLKQLNACNSA